MRAATPSANRCRIRERSWICIPLHTPESKVSCATRTASSMPAWSALSATASTPPVAGLTTSSRGPRPSTTRPPIRSPVASGPEESSTVGRMSAVVMAPPRWYTTRRDRIHQARPGQRRHRARVVSGPVAVVTGGTRGIGAATAELLADRGHHLVLGYRSRQEEARALAIRLGEGGVEVRTVRCDVADDGDVEKLFAVADELGPLAALVNSAGVLEDQRPMVGIDTARWARVFAVNVFGTAACC